MITFQNTFRAKIIIYTSVVLIINFNFVFCDFANFRKYCNPFLLNWMCPHFLFARSIPSFLDVFHHFCFSLWQSFSFVFGYAKFTQCVFRILYSASRHSVIQYSPRLFISTELVTIIILIIYVQRVWNPMGLN